jgi:hypothetical protein
MVHVRDVWVGMLHGFVFVKMGMRLAGRIDDTVGMTMVFIMHVPMRVSHRSMEVLMFMMPRMCSHTPVAISTPAMMSCDVTGSSNAMIAATLPMNGAVEKYALVRAVPSPRSARTNKTRLMP